MKLDVSFDEDDDDDDSDMFDSKFEHIFSIQLATVVVFFSISADESLS